MISDTLWHLVIRVQTHGTGMDRRLDYALSDVVRHTQEGADPLAEWAARRPDEVGLWLTWHPVRGMHYAGVTANVSALGNVPVQEPIMPPGLARAVLAGITLALRIDSGEFGACDRASASRPAFFGGPDASDCLDNSESIDPETLEITDGH